MFDSPEALLAAYRHENKGRSRRARAQAVVDKCHFSHTLTICFLLEAWARGVATRIESLHEKEPREKISTLVKRAHESDLRDRQPVRGCDVFGSVPSIEF